MNAKIQNKRQIPKGSVGILNLTGVKALCVICITSTNYLINCRK